MGSTENDRLDYQQPLHDQEQQQMEEEYERLCWEIGCLVRRKVELASEIDNRLSTHGLDKR